MARPTIPESNKLSLLKFFRVSSTMDKAIARKVKREQLSRPGYNEADLYREAVSKYVRT